MQKVLVFGMGNMYKEKKRYIQAQYEIVGYLDNNAAEIKDAWENSQEDMSAYVCLPEESQEIQERDVRVILMSYEFVPMWKQLHRLGVTGNKIIFGLMLPPFGEDEKELFQSGRLEILGTDIVYCHEAGRKCIIENYGDIKKIARGLKRERYQKENPLIGMIAKMPCHPVSRMFGTERGTAVDRHYIEKFLEEKKKYIHGKCLEIAENTYTVLYGEDRVEKAYILHVEGTGEDAIKGNLATGEGLCDGMYDCMIITQTLMFIFDIQSAARNIYRMLKTGGTALITVSGISQVSRYDAERWGSCYGFHEDAMRKLFVPLFGEENVEIHSYGNVKTATALLWGLCCEDLQESDYDEKDEDYPVIVSAVLKKR